MSGIKTDDEDQDYMELVPNIILNPGFMDADPRPTRDVHTYAASIIRSSERAGPGKPRRVWFSSILNFRIFYRTDSGHLSWLSVNRFDGQPMSSIPLQVKSLSISDLRFWSPHRPFDWRNSKIGSIFCQKYKDFLPVWIYL